MPRRSKRKSCRYQNLKPQDGRNRRAAGCVCLICDKGGKDVQVYEEINTFLIKDMLLGARPEVIKSLGENVYKEVWLCSKCKLLVEDARTIYEEVCLGDGMGMIIDDEGVSELQNNFRVLREQISEMMRNSWKDGISKETMKNLTYTRRSILVRSLFEGDMDVDVKPDVSLLDAALEAGSGSQEGQPEVKKKRNKSENKKKVKEEGSPENNTKVLNYVATKLDEEGEQGSYTCTTCSFVTPDLETMEIHQAEEHQVGNKSGREVEDERLPCPQCGRTYKNSNSLWSHISLVHNKNNQDGEKVCPHCGRTFQRYGCLSRHISDTHKTCQEQLCPNCGKTFKNRRSFNRHVCDTGPDGVGHSCSSCGQIFSTSIARMVHERSVHEGLPVHKCPEPGCTMVYPILSKLQSHIRATHNNVRPFVCERCGSGFKTKSAWLLHQGSRCNNDPKEREKIKDIMRRQKKWRICDQCDFKTFGVMQQLNKHVKNMHKKDNDGVEEVEGVAGIE